MAVRDSQAVRLMWGYLRDAAEAVPALPEMKEARGRVPMRWYNRALKAADKAGRASAQRAGRPDMFDLGAAAGAVAAFMNEHAPSTLPVRPDATDYEICMKARRIAGDVQLKVHGLELEEALVVCASTCERYGVELPDFSAAADRVARVKCELWWRRRLRTKHIRALERSNIHLHYVHYRSDPYASNDAVRRRLAQNRRNRQTLERTSLENEHGQRFTLAELADKSIANKALRRGELMTRLKGMEELAEDVKFAGVMFTKTCPSRFHAVKQMGNKWQPNAKYEGADPREGQGYLRRVWARIRAELKRLGVVYFGLRVAEPHHDGCPHWHGLIFSNRIDVVCAVIRKHALKDSPEEAGASLRRCRFEHIDSAKGSAVGYIAKYISKNIDGHAVGDHKTAEGYVVQADFLGDDVITPSERVEAWAATWGIRQFQAFGGAPVGVWRELRRVKEADLPTEEESPEIRAAWAAAQKTEEKGASWADYARAMGGVAGEGRRIAIKFVERMEEGRYGMAVRQVPQGVQAVGRAHIVDGMCDYWRTTQIFVPATRYEWREVSRSGAAASTRTRVNNCTRRKGAKDGKPFWLEEIEASAPPHALETPPTCGME
ncbi:replication endonuclease [Ralstonia sp. NFACC01]|uniref:replication endonuclease n=1 Tax=Ralstonia sp. NFACC01 TaxID=1566294 RepID=UPI0008EAB757|nr:replication endonuclease [Ralstonia sp. NFACC01]SFQ19079.1 Bacteriophage replication gene A protein (GPA) [Ralstonia sp. NFACC01]